MSSLHARFGLIQICLAGILWGTGGLVLQIVRAITPMSVLTVSAYRMLIASVSLFAVLAIIGRLRELRLDRRTVIVGVATGLYQALYFGAVVAVGVTVSTVVSIGIAPAILLTGEAVAARRWPTRRQLIVLVTALFGLVLASAYAGSRAGGDRPVTGVLLAIAAGSAYALTTAVGRPLAQRRSPLLVTAGATGAGAVVLVPLALVGGGTFVSSSATVWAWLVYLGVATMALGYGLLYAGLRTTRSSAAGVATLMEPVAAAIAAAAVLGERLAGPAVAGVALILVAIAGLA
ncbi:DME family drug/metabolite transporter [Nocardioides luteus]|uniref:Membrane protein n=1 Tax=Nocardioides luteus TaxID=1844 RepID=A0ABQ5SYZ8_9ACTN|nr:DMT family transporter [Nocardioides luteus]MDR7310808.1 DME family drug/metabolite transporter [Nocardioides luteus]GGR40515.1 membrane protein [Nocardioides luteus]GLJ69412.1 membrane protein [Nocardioides luteus]